MFAERASRPIKISKITLALFENFFWN
uniref:Uncharacterized protein n=1 Tax=Arundo donax TaxID=35708 RepID=A0A0A9B889_ARUDO